MAATIHDVAKRAGVGIGTVSSVINNSRAVNEETRKRVMQAIAELDYTPHPAARQLSSGKTFNIGAIIPFFTRPAAVERLRGVMSVIAPSEYDFTLFSVETSAQRAEQLKDVPRRGRVDGLIIFSCPPTPREAQRILASNIPTVLIDGYHPDLNCIYIDNVAGGYTATKHLIELGHRRIGYLGDPIDDPIGFFVSRDRFQGYRRALDEAGIPFNPAYHREGQHSLESGREMARSLLQQPNPPTALFAFSDTIAFGVMEAAKELGLSIPDDLALIGFDDIELARLYGLSTMRQQLFQTGVTGAEMLLNLIGNPDTEQRQIQLSTELIVRHSTAGHQNADHPKEVMPIHL